MENYNGDSSKELFSELQIHLITDHIRESTKSAIIETSIRHSRGRIIPLVLTSSRLQEGAMEAIENVPWFLATYEQVNHCQWS